MTPVTYSDNDGSIPHALLIADGPRFDQYVAFDLVVERFGAAAGIMRGALKAGAKTVRVQFPDGKSREYVDLPAARRAIERHAHQQRA